jgi:hypothetical protein
MIPVSSASSPEVVAGSIATTIIVDCLPCRGIILDRAAHALDRLLRRVARLAFAVRDLPQRGLRPIALPMPRLGSPHGIPARLVLKVVVASGNDVDGLRPDKLRSHFKPAGFERFLNCGDMQGTVPDVNDLARVQGPGLAPIRSVVIPYVAEGAAPVSFAI